MSALIPLCIAAGVFLVGALALFLVRASSRPAAPEPPPEQMELRDESHLWADIENLPY